MTWTGLPVVGAGDIENRSQRTRGFFAEGNCSWPVRFVAEAVGLTRNGRMHEQSVGMFLCKAMPSAHMLSNSPFVAANAVVAKPRMKSW